jgi:hypothetical protein
MRSYRRNLAFTIVLSCLFTNLNTAAYAQSLASADPMPPVLPFALIPSVRPVQPVVESLKARPIKTTPDVLRGEVCSERVHALTSDMAWFTNLHRAEAQAKAENKLVLWVHMVGKIDGAT